MSEYSIPLSLLLISSALTSYVATAIVRHAAQHIGAVDVPGERRTHAGVTPRLGGLAIIFGFGFPLLLLGVDRSSMQFVNEQLSLLFGVLAAGSLIVGLGVYDDIIGANASKKFAVQFAAAAILVVFGFRFEEISVAGRVINLGLFGDVASMIWIVGVINAMNFIDGMDSLATVIAITTATAFTTIAALRQDPFSMLVMVALTGSLIGFYPWNKPPAKIFMGDTGSMFIGLLLAAASIAKPSKSPTFFLIGGPMLALALPVIDTLIVMKQRFGGRNTESGLRTRVARVFSADRSHIHHILIAKYGSDAKAIFFIWLVTLLFAVAAVLTVVQSTKKIGYWSGGIAFVVLLVLRYRRKRAVTPDSAAERG